MTCQTLKYHAVAFECMSYGKLQPNIKNIIEAVTLYSPVSVTAELPDTTLSAPWKKPEIAPKPIMGIVLIKRGNKVHHSSQSTKSVKSVTKVLFKNTQDSSTDSDDVFFYKSSDTSPQCS